LAATIALSSEAPRAVDHPIALAGGKWVNRPVRAIDGNNILVPHDEQRALFPVALEPRNVCVTYSESTSLLFSQGSLRLLHAFKPY
jgi:hypothetical protein